MPPPCCWPTPAPPRVRMRCPQAACRRPSRARPTLHHSAQPPIGAKPINIDPELLTLYIEEAREEVARIAKLFPAWEQNPLETDALVRRAPRVPHAQGFRPHGRRHRHRRIRVVHREPAQQDHREHAAAFPGDPRHRARRDRDRRRTGELRSKPARARRAKVQAIVDRAHALAANKAGPSAQTATMEILERTLETRREDVDRRDRPRAHVAGGADLAGGRRRLTPVPAIDGPVSIGVRSTSWKTGRSNDRGGRRRNRAVRARRRTERRPAAARHLQPRNPGQHRRGAALRRRASVRAAAPHVVSEEAYRACHTLSGSSRMAEARHGIRLTAPLEHWVRKSFDSGVGLEASDLDLLARLHERHAVGRRASRRIDRFLPVAHRAAGAHRSGHRTSRTAHRRGRARGRSHRRAATGCRRPGFRRAGGRGASRFLSAGSSGPRARSRIGSRSRRRRA